MIVFGLKFIHEQVDLPTIPCIVEMERAGVLIDRDRLSALGPEVEAKLSSLEESVEHIAGHPVNLRSPVQVASLLYDEIRLPVTDWRSPRGTDADILDALAPHHPAPRLIRDHRRLAKLAGTYIGPILGKLHTDGRLYARFNHARVITGRLSSADPNLQNIPKRVEPGTPYLVEHTIKEIRKCFVARPGWTLVRFDQAAVEYKILCMLAGDTATMAKLNQGIDVHCDTVAQYLRLPYDQVVALRKSGGSYQGVPIEQYRNLCKTVVYGTCYGQGPENLAKVATASGMPTTTAQANALQSAILGTKPEIVAWIEESKRAAQVYGYSETFFGRRVYTPDARDERRGIREAALRTAVNGRIQGTQSDIMRMIMATLRRERLSRGMQSLQILAVHDECVFEAPEGEADDLAAMIKQTAEHIVDWPIVLTVDVETGANWGETHPIQH